MRRRWGAWGRGADTQLAGSQKQIRQTAELRAAYEQYMDAVRERAHGVRGRGARSAAAPS